MILNPGEVKSGYVGPLEPGYEECEHCKGTGTESAGMHGITQSCHKCWGSGKINWLEKVFGKQIETFSGFAGMSGFSGVSGNSISKPLPDVPPPPPIREINDDLFEFGKTIKKIYNYAKNFIERK